jgi:hypothetical protein
MWGRPDGKSSVFSIFIRASVDETYERKWSEQRQQHRDNAQAKRQSRQYVSDGSTLCHKLKWPERNQEYPGMQQIAKVKETCSWQ